MGFPDFSTQVSRFVSRETLQRVSLGYPAGPSIDRFEGAVGMFDISGFTKLSSRLRTEEQAKLEKTHAETRYRRSSLGPIGDKSATANFAAASLASQSLSAEMLTAQLNRMFGCVIEVIERYGGDIIKFVGDAMIVMWTNKPHGQRGLLARNELAELGVRAMACANEAVAALEGADSSLGIHISLATGAILHCVTGGFGGCYEAFIAGPAVVDCLVALDSAGVGEVIVSGDMRSAVRGYLDSLGAGADVFRAASLQGETTARVEVFDGGAAFRFASLRAAAPPKLPQPTAALAALVTPFVAEPFVAALDATRAGARSEMRKLAVLFMAIGGIPARPTDAKSDAACLRSIQRAILAVQEACAHHGAVLRQFVFDDKGFIAVVCCGLPNNRRKFAPELQDEDPAVSALLVVRRFQAKVPAVAKMTKFGVTVGDCFCGPVGATTDEAAEEATVMRRRASSGAPGAPLNAGWAAAQELLLPSRRRASSGAARLQGPLAALRSPENSQSQRASLLAAAVSAFARGASVAAKPLEASPPVEEVKDAAPAPVHSPESSRLAAIGRQEYAVVGDAVNLAARLMAKASTGDVLVDASVADAAGRHGFPLAEAEAFIPKGKSTLIRNFRLLPVDQYLTSSDSDYAAAADRNPDALRPVPRPGELRRRDSHRRRNSVGVAEADNEMPPDRDLLRSLHDAFVDRSGAANACERLILDRRPLPAAPGASPGPQTQLRTLIVAGGAGLGKSVLLRAFALCLDEADFFVLHTTCHGHDHAHSFSSFRALAAQAVRMLLRISKDKGSAPSDDERRPSDNSTEGGISLPGTPVSLPALAIQQRLYATSPKLSPRLLHGVAAVRHPDEQALLDRGNSFATMAQFDRAGCASPGTSPNDSSQRRRASAAAQASLLEADADDDDGLLGFGGSILRAAGARAAGARHKRATYDGIAGFSLANGAFSPRSSFSSDGSDDENGAFDFAGPLRGAAAKREQHFAEASRRSFDIMALAAPGPQRRQRTRSSDSILCPGADNFEADNALFEVPSPRPSTTSDAGSDRGQDVGSDASPSNASPRAFDAARPSPRGAGFDPQPLSTVRSRHSLSLNTPRGAPPSPASPPKGAPLRDASPLMHGAEIAYADIAAQDAEAAAPASAADADAGGATVETPGFARGRPAAIKAREASDSRRASSSSSDDSTPAREPSEIAREHHAREPPPRQWSAGSGHTGDKPALWSFNEDDCAEPDADAVAPPLQHRRNSDQGTSKAPARRPRNNSDLGLRSGCFLADASLRSATAAAVTAAAQPACGHERASSMRGLASAAPGLVSLAPKRRAPSFAPEAVSANTEKAPTMAALQLARLVELKHVTRADAAHLLVFLVDEAVNSDRAIVFYQSVGHDGRANSHDKPNRHASQDVGDALFRLFLRCAAVTSSFTLKALPGAAPPPLGANMSVLIDNAHNLDSMSCELLFRLRSKMPEFRLCLSHRPLADKRHARFDGLLALLGLGVAPKLGSLAEESGDLVKPHAQALALGPLTRLQARLLVTSGPYRGVPLVEVQAELIDFVLERSAGNPCVALEVLHELREKGIAAVDDQTGVLRLARETRDVDFDVPASIRAAVTTSFDSLDGAAQATIRLASVLGSRVHIVCLAYLFWFFFSEHLELERVCAWRDFGDAGVVGDEPSASASASGLTFEVTGSVDFKKLLARLIELQFFAFEAECHLVFVSDQTRKVIYHQMLASDRKSVHEHVVTWHTSQLHKLQAADDAHGGLWKKGFSAPRVAGPGGFGPGSFRTPRRSSSALDGALFVAATAAADAKAAVAKAALARPSEFYQWNPPSPKAPSRRSPSSLGDRPSRRAFGGSLGDRPPAVEVLESAPSASRAMAVYGEIAYHALCCDEPILAFHFCALAFNCAMEAKLVDVAFGYINDCALIAENHSLPEAVAPSVQVSMMRATAFVARDDYEGAIYFLEMIIDETNFPKGCAAALASMLPPNRRPRRFDAADSPRTKTAPVVLKGDRARLDFPSKGTTLAACVAAASRGPPGGGAALGRRAYDLRAQLKFANERILRARLKLKSHFFRPGPSRRCPRVHPEGPPTRTGPPILPRSSVSPRHALALHGHP